MILSEPMASNVQESPVAQQTFVEEIDYNEIQELQVFIINSIVKNMVLNF